MPSDDRSAPTICRFWSLLWLVAALAVLQGVLRVREWSQGMSARAAVGKPTAPWRTPGWVVGSAVFVLNSVALVGAANLLDTYLQSAAFSGQAVGPDAAVALVLSATVLMAAELVLVPLAAGWWQRYRVRRRDRDYLTAVAAYRDANPDAGADDPMDPYLQTWPAPEPLPTGARILV